MKDATLRRFCKIVVAFPLIVLCSASAAQNYPSKPVRFIVGFPPGGTNDIVARALGQKLSENLGQQFVIENRGGANTAIASELFVRTPPDGYTIMLNAPGHATNPTLMKLRFDPIKDFAFITCAAESQNLVVAPSLVSAEEREGADRILEDAAGRDQLRLLGRRHHRAPVGGALPVHDRRQVDAHPVQRRRAGGDRSPGRSPRALLRQRPERDPARASGKAARDRDDGTQAHLRRAGRADGGRRAAYADSR